MNDQQRSTKLEQLYAALPKIDCKKKCAECCGPIALTRLELKRLEAVAGKIKAFRLPIRTLGDGFLGTQWMLKTGPCDTCPLLRNGECSAYNVRPAICRLWGLVERMRCPHCAPERFMTDLEAYEFMDQVRTIGF